MAEQEQNPQLPAVLIRFVNICCLMVFKRKYAHYPRPTLEKVERMGLLTPGEVTVSDLLRLLPMGLSRERSHRRWLSWTRVWRAACADRKVRVFWYADRCHRVSLSFPAPPPPSEHSNANRLLVARSCVIRSEFCVKRTAKRSTRFGTARGSSFSAPPRTILWTCWKRSRSRFRAHGECVDSGVIVH